LTPPVPDGILGDVQVLDRSIGRPLTGHPLPQADMKYKYLPNRGALNEAATDPATRQVAGPASEGDRLLAQPIPRHVVELVPESVARENRVMPVAFDGETLTFAAVNAADIGLTDKLRFILNKNVRLVAASEAEVVRAINFYYGRAETESVDSMLAAFTDSAIDSTRTSIDLDAPSASGTLAPGVHDARMRTGRRLKGLTGFKQGGWGLPGERGRAPQAGGQSGLDGTPSVGGSGVFFYVVEEGQRVLMRRPNGTMEVITGPRRVWRGRKVFRAMAHHVAHPGEFLIVRFRDGRQEHVAGPAEVWLDPRVHQEVTREDALQLAAKEAVVVYSKPAGSEAITRRIEHGPGLFIPKPGEWLHTFSWHASVGGHQGVQKVPNGLVFQKLWLMPDQMYHDVTDVRTSDDALLTVRLMIFYELVDIGRMLDTTHDPIGDFVNATTSDVVAAVGRLDFDTFKRNTSLLNELETYGQLTNRATQCGYRINKVVYRGYGAPGTLQQMHDKAIEARTKLQLDRATEQQAQDLENYKLDCQIARAGKRRTEQATEVEHDLEMVRRRQDNDLRHREATQSQQREQRRLEAESQMDLRLRQDAQLREHVTALRELGVDLTAYLTQARADRVIELRGTKNAHVHLAQESDGTGKK
jgi:hypothetical protein